MISIKTFDLLEIINEHDNDKFIEFHKICFITICVLDVCNTCNILF